MSVDEKKLREWLEALNLMLIKERDSAQGSIRDNGTSDYWEGAVDVMDNAIEWLHVNPMPASPTPEGDTEEQEPAAEHAQRGPSTSDYKPRAVPNGSTVVQRAVNQALKGVGSPHRINSHIAAAAVHAMEAMGWQITRTAPGDTETVTLYRLKLAHMSVWGEAWLWVEVNEGMEAAEFARISPVRPASSTEGGEE